MQAFSEFTTLSDVALATLPFLQSGRVALSGGSTYKRLMEEWVRLSPNLSKTEFFPVDERRAPFLSDASNWGIAYRLFLSKVGRAADTRHWVQSVDEYKKILTGIFATTIPIFDTVFLGVGDDGHTASLFPGTIDVDNMTDAVLATKSPKPPFDRITLGPAVLAAAKKVVVIVAGSGKLSIFQRILANDASLPIVRVLQRCRNPDIYIEHR